MRFAFIAAKKAEHRVTILCRCMRVTRSGFYAWVRRGLSARAQRDVILRTKLRAFHAASGHRYGRPRLWKETIGTVEISAVGMFGNGAGWGIPPAPAATLMVTVGGIGEKPVVVDGHVAVREYLSLTISFDHNIIDGAPAARFTQSLKELIESGYGLFDSTVESKQAGAEAAAQKR